MHRARYDRLVASGRLDAVTDPGLAEDFAALDGRLWKDLAQRSPPEEALRYRLLSANAYAAAWRRFGRYYSAINAASMFLAAGNGADATGIRQAPPSSSRRKRRTPTIGLWQPGLRRC